MLDSWEQVIAHLEGRYEIARRGDGWLQLVWRFCSDDGPPLMQVAEITRTETLGQTFVRVLARVAHHRALDANAALRLNFSLVVGHLARHDDAMVVMHYLQLGVATKTLDLALELVPHEAARLRHTLSHGYVTSAPLIGYAD